MQDDLDRELRELDRDRRREELRQLRAGQWRHWLTPAALAALGGIGLFLWAEIRGIAEDYLGVREMQAVAAERDRLAAERDALLARRADLNGEIASLMAQYGFHAEEARRLRDDATAREAEIERAWTRAAWAAGELGYTLAHAEALPPAPDRAAIDALAGRLGGADATLLRDLAERADLSALILDLARDSLGPLEAARTLLPVPDRIGRLAYQPSPDGALLFWPLHDPREVYDTEAGRFLSEAEIRALTP